MSPFRTCVDCRCGRAEEATPLTSAERNAIRTSSVTVFGGPLLMLVASVVLVDWLLRTA